MVSINHQGIILHIIIASPTLPQLLWNASRRSLLLYTCNYNIRVNLFIEMVLIQHFFTRIRSMRIISRLCSLFILSLHTLALHLAVKILSKSSSEDLSTLALHGICRLYFPPECQQDRTLLRNQYSCCCCPHLT